MAAFIMRIASIATIDQSEMISDLPVEVQEQCKRYEGLIPSPGSIYRHYKGTLYRVEAIGMREEDLTLQVCYRSVEAPMEYAWIRPVEQWLEKVELDNGHIQNRFTLV